MSRLLGQTQQEPRQATENPSKPHRLDVRLDNESVKQLARDYESGASAEELGRRYELSKGSVLRLLRESGAKLRWQSVPVDMVAECVRLSESGLTLREIALHMVIPKSTVQDALCASGMPTRPAKRRPRRS